MDLREGGSLVREGEGWSERLEKSIAEGLVSLLVFNSQPVGRVISKQ